MKTVFVVIGIDSGLYCSDSWVSSVFDSEDKAYAYVSEMEGADEHGEYSYMVKQWEVE